MGGRSASISTRIVDESRSYWCDFVLVNMGYAYEKTFQSDFFRRLHGEIPIHLFIGIFYEKNKNSEGNSKRRDWRYFFAIDTLCIGD